MNAFKIFVPQPVGLILTLAACAILRQAHAVTIDTVPVGNAGNSADTRYLDNQHPNGVGAVGYAFRIGKTEVTNAHYVEFLNAVAASDPYGLYSESPGSPFPAGGIVRSGAAGSYTYSVRAAALSGVYSYDNRPVVYVDFGDAMRFSNWLHNGQPAGAQDASMTEEGAYTLNGATSNAALLAVTRNPGARWWLPSEDEWYKAAYHKNDGVTGNYWEYPTGNNSSPGNNPPSGDAGNSANFNFNGYTTGDTRYPLTSAGAYTLSDGPYGTFDQAGNVWEWTEAVFYGTDRVVRGGSYFNGPAELRAASWGYDNSTTVTSNFGFRVATLAIPEPSTSLLLVSGAASLFLMRRRSAVAQPIVLVATVVVFLGAPTTAHAITIHTVPIGNPSNIDDTRYVSNGFPAIGSVDYKFRMGKTEVTNAEYVEFLNAVAASDPYGLYSADMGDTTWGGVLRNGTSGSFTYSVKPPAAGQGPGGSDYTYDGKPVVFVNWFRAVRFANWLHNGQGGPGTTEYGAYTLLGGTTVPSNANTITRNPVARWWLPSEGEWYKAAYHKNDGVTANYWDYPTGTNEEPNNNLPGNDTGNSANFFNGDYATGDFEYSMTNAGAYGLSDSSYGTLDQGGNVWEWNETAFETLGSADKQRGGRGGSWQHMSGDLHPTGNTYSTDPSNEFADSGFRVATFDLPGDFNHDGTVDTADYIVWRKNPGGVYTPEDYNTWRSHFGQTFAIGSSSSGSAMSAVPEPAATLYLIYCLAIGFVRRWPAASGRFFAIHPSRSGGLISSKKIRGAPRTLTGKSSAGGQEFSFTRTFWPVRSQPRCSPTHPPEY